ncbi:MAG: FIG022979: MoxR-like ATPases, partial [uncultured Thermomicrobiales bacterium]
ADPDPDRFIHGSRPGRPFRRRVRGAGGGERGAGDRRQGRRGRAAAGGDALRGPRPDRRRAGGRQDEFGPGAGALDRRGVPANPMHAGSAAVRHRRGLVLRPEGGRFPVPGRAGVRQRGPGRRDQPRHAAHPVRPARSDGRADRLRRGRTRPPSPSVPGPGDREPDRTRRHVSAARSAVGPLPDPPRPRLPGRDRGGRDPAPGARPGRRPAALGHAGPGRLPGRAAGGGGRGAAGPRRRRRGALCRVHRPRHPRPRGGRVGRQPARRPRLVPGSAGVGGAAGAVGDPAGRRQNPGRAGPLPPPDPGPGGAAARPDAGRHRRRGGRGHAGAGRRRGRLAPPAGRL